MNYVDKNAVNNDVTKLQIQTNVKRYLYRVENDILLSIERKMKRLSKL